MPSGEYTHNHYVPEWYQKRFMPNGEVKFHYLDLSPPVRINNGHCYRLKEVRRLGPPSCFAEANLYTTNWLGTANNDIEKHFFGEIDTRARAAVKFFTNYEIKDGLHDAFRDLVRYMSVQKLRTPKGLSYLEKIFPARDRNQLLLHLQRYENLHCAIWTDAVWQIADASESPTKFILNDHPVTIYNRACFPASKYCRNFMDPDIRHVGSHTLFPLSYNKILILTNLAWVRDPYQNELRFGPNEKLFHTTIFNGTDIQQGRKLSELEVRQINYVLKKRAYRYVASPVKDWLYPETHLPSTHWSRFGGGFLFMPEPRGIHMGGETFVGYKDGRSEAWNEYGQRPWEKDYQNQKRFNRESATLTRFQDEFAARFGASWRGWPYDYGKNGPQADSDEHYQRRLERAARHRRKASK